MFNLIDFLKNLIKKLLKKEKTLGLPEPINIEAKESFLENIKIESSNNEIENLIYSIKIGECNLQEKTEQDLDTIKDKLNKYILNLERKINNEKTEIGIIDLQLSAYKKKNSNLK